MSLRQILLSATVPTYIQQDLNSKLNLSNPTLIRASVVRGNVAHEVHTVNDS